MKIWGTFLFFFRIFMKFEAKNLSPVAFHALACGEVSVSIQRFDWSKMAAEGFPVARIDEYAKLCEPAIHVLRSVPGVHKLLSGGGVRHDVKGGPSSLLRDKKKDKKKPNCFPVKLGSGFEARSAHPHPRGVLP